MAHRRWPKSPLSHHTVHSLTEVQTLWSTSDSIRPLRIKLVWFLVGCVGLVLGIAGVFVPLLPATPFLLIGAYGFARSSPRIHKWLIEHPYLGTLIGNWHKHGAISRRDKGLPGFTMIATFLISSVAGVAILYLVIQVLALFGAAAFVFSRPLPP